MKPSSEDVAVLLMSFGAVQSLDDLEQYYTNIRGGRRPSPEELADLRARYERIGGRSPLLDITLRQASLLERRLRDGGLHVPVRVGMKFWHPTIPEAVQQLHREGITRVIAFTSGPYDSRMSVGSYERQLETARKDAPGLSFDLVRQWFDHPALETAWRERVEATLRRKSWSTQDTYFLFSAHSLPERVLMEADSYPVQFLEHGRRMAAALRVPKWGYTYQSAGLVREPWLGPDVLQALEYVKTLGERRILVVPIGFIADHLEILNDLDHDARRRTGELGLEFERVESLNDSPHLIEMYRDIVARRLALTSVPRR